MAQYEFVIECLTVYVCEEDERNDCDLLMTGYVLVYSTVCNKWFHERGQEFIRPCSLSADE